MKNKKVMCHDEGEDYMNNIERRDKQILYISDEAVLEEQKKCRTILQKLNFMDRADSQWKHFPVLSSVLLQPDPARSGIQRLHRHPIP